MFRSAYIIGLGGTGQWILTYLKKELLEINQGTPPDNVKLLAIDTQISEVSVASSNASMVDSDKIKNRTDAHLGDVRLDKQVEFLQIGQELFTFVQQIQKDRQLPQDKRMYAYLDWVDTERLLKLGKGACDATWGAGAFRQLGRLSLFNKVDVVFNHLKTDLEALNRARPADETTQQIEIHIACSVAGGTGAGILVDIAWLVRAAAQSLGMNNYVLRAFILQPTTFDLANTDTGKQLRAYAAWSELDRFMISQVAVQGHTKIVFNPYSNPRLEVDCNMPVFDTTYIIDPNRNENPIAPPPENGTFPAVSQAISFILDQESGSHYAAHAPNVHVGGALSLPPGVYHSSIGSYTLKVPVFRARTKFSRELAFATYEKLIQPKLSDADRGIGLRSDRNRENPQNPSAAISSLLTTAALQDQNGQPVASTALFPHIEEVYQKSLAGPEAFATYVLNESNNVVDRRGNTFTSFLERVPLSSPTDEITRNIDTVRREHIWQQVKASGDMGKTPAQNFPTVVAGIKTKDVEWFGQSSIEKVDNQTKTMRTTEGSRAKTLREVKGKQVDTYKTLLRLWVFQMLNGIHHDPIIAKEGKIGYVQASLGELTKRIEAYGSYLKALKQRMSDNKTIVNRQKNSEAAMGTYNNLKSKKCILCFYDQNVHPKARQSERDYLRKTNKLFEAVLAEQLIAADEATASELLLVTQKTVNEVGRWAELLVMGKNTDNKEKDYTGLYNQMRERMIQNRNDLKTELDQGNPNFDTNKNLRGVLQIIQPQLALAAYQNNQRWEDNQPAKVYDDDDNIRSIFKQLTWKAEPNAAGDLVLGCGFKDEKTGQVSWMNDAPSEEKVSENYFTWLQKAQLPFTNLAEDHPIDTEIQKDFPNAETLANEVVAWCKPMYHHRPVRTGAYDKTIFVRIDDTRAKTYFDTFRTRMKGLAAGAGGWQVNPNVPTGQKNSTDPYKLTVIHTEHLMPTADFQIWGDIRDLFMNTASNPGNAADPLINFIYLAEKNAMELASKKPSMLKKNFEPFDPMIVSLLEDQEKTLMFFLGYALGLIKRTKVGNGYSWTYGDVTLYEAGQLLADQKTPSIFDIVRFWTVGRDCRPNKSNINPIDKNDVRKAIIEKETKNKKEIGKLYEASIEKMVKLIEEDKQEQFRLLNEADRRYFQSQRYVDLQDLATIYYMQAKERIK